MTFITLTCRICGRFHGSIAHESANRVHFSSLIAANSNFDVEKNSRPVTRKRMSAHEAMARTKVRYEDTLEYLT